ncbi:MAG: flagellar basal body L-ring protein FlgH [Planctomycetia bacterium]|nr:flagellar basal body L-ring protein FlgH [Planctomycetia bacterium]
MRHIAILIAIILVTSSWAGAQSNSLFLQSLQTKAEQAAATTQPAANGSLPATAGTTQAALPVRNVAVSQLSLTAATPPEPKVIQVHDLLTVIVRHRLRYQSEARTNQQSTWDLESTLDSWFRIHDSKWVDQSFRGGTPSIEFENKNRLQNQGRADRKDIFETRVMAEVLDIKPNGNLVIGAHSRVKIGEEDQLIVLTGVCNKNDIAPDNSILSDKIFALDVVTENDGAMQDLANRGWLKRLMDDVKPF